MKRITIKYALVALVGLLVASCSSWTDPKSVKINMPTVNNMNPEYLASLRAYRQTNHKSVYVWYNNTHDEVVQNRSQHIDALPDSIDYIVLMNPDSLAKREIQEIDTVRNQKGMKVLLSVDYDAIKAAYDATLPVGTPEDSTTFTTLLTNQVNARLALVNKYNYDGIIFKYNGVSSLHLSPADLTLFTAFQESYLSLIQTWHAANSSKMFVFQGHPENLLDNTILQSCKNIIIDCTDALSVSGLAYDVELTLSNGVPADRYVALVSTVSSDPADLKTGYFADGTTTIIPTAVWVAQPSTGSYTKVGIGILNVQNDFFNPTFTYPNVRTAINTLNPAPNE